MNFMRQLTQLRTDVQEDLYTELKEAHGRRPSISEFYFAGGSIDTIRKSMDNGSTLWRNRKTHRRRVLCISRAPPVPKGTRDYLTK